ncbi:MAG: hypothetical protein JXL81_09715 [Deltaproteobacteria bacterium]|nr:hypothetical protein [Deltaproteobacteria bacterium]
MEYRLDKNHLLSILQEWNRFLKRKVHIIACGGTAMTLTGAKSSTKDVDFMLPVEREYDYLIKQLKSLGYKNITGAGWKNDKDIFIFDLFRGKFIHTTELTHSPLDEGMHTVVIEYSHLFIGVLNDYDLISSKLMRGSRVDFEDCIKLVSFHREEINIARLVKHFYELISYDISEERLKPNMDHFLELLKEEGLYD